MRTTTVLLALLVLAVLVPVGLVVQPLVRYGPPTGEASGRQPGLDFSDHLNYWNRGFPALMVTDTSFLRNPAYHRPTDTQEKLDYERMAQVVQGVYAVVRQL
jgi:hypothetical protein